MKFLLKLLNQDLLSLLEVVTDPFYGKIPKEQKSDSGQNLLHKFFLQIDLEDPSELIKLDYLMENFNLVGMHDDNGDTPLHTLFNMVGFEDFDVSKIQEILRKVTIYDKNALLYKNKKEQTVLGFCLASFSSDAFDILNQDDFVDLFNKKNNFQGSQELFCEQYALSKKNDEFVQKLLLSTDHDLKRFHDIEYLSDLYVQAEENQCYSSKIVLEKMIFHKMPKHLLGHRYFTKKVVDFFEGNDFTSEIKFSLYHQIFHIYENAQKYHFFHLRDFLKSKLLQTIHLLVYQNSPLNSLQLEKILQLSVETQSYDLQSAIFLRLGKLKERNAQFDKRAKSQIFRRQAKVHREILKYSSKDLEQSVPNKPIDAGKRSSSSSLEHNSYHSPRNWFKKLKSQ